MAVEKALSPVELAVMVLLEQNDRPSGLTHDQIARALQPSPVVEALGHGIDAETLTHPGDGKSQSSRSRYRITQHGREQLRAQASATSSMLEQMATLTTVQRERDRLARLRPFAAWALAEYAKVAASRADDPVSVESDDEVADPAELQAVAPLDASPSVAVSLPVRRRDEVARLAAKARKSDRGHQDQPKRLDASAE